MLVLVALLVGACLGDSRVDHVVVLMLENQSFLRVFGSFPGVSTPASRKDCNPTGNDTSVCMQFGPPRVQRCDPDHGLDATTAKIYGLPPNMTRASMSGFALWEEKKQGNGKDNNYCDTLTSFLPAQLPVLNWLASEFALFDEYFASVPGPTWPNRAFALAASSGGETSTGKWNHRNGCLFAGRTIFDQLDAANKTWGYYYQTTPWELFMEGVYTNTHRLSHFSEFVTAAKQGTLPAYSWINPRSGIDDEMRGSNDFHPDHDAALAEAFVSEIYYAVRNSPAWERTLFVITMDEHGGFYDAFPPPSTGVPPPDVTVGLDGFQFDRLGIRVPTIAVSPWIARGTLVHANSSLVTRPFPLSQLEHSSLVATTRKLLGVIEGPLSHRDAWASTFERLLSLPSPRKDVPLSTPPPPAPGSAEEEYNLPLNDLQIDLLRMHEKASGAHWIKRPLIQGHLHKALQRHHSLTLKKLHHARTQLSLVVLPKDAKSVGDTQIDSLEKGFSLVNSTIRSLTLNVSNIAFCLTRVDDAVGVKLCGNGLPSQQFEFSGEDGSIRHVPTGQCVAVERLSDGTDPAITYGSFSLVLASKCDQSVSQSFSFYSTAPAGADIDDNSFNWGDDAGYMQIVSGLANMREV